MERKLRIHLRALKSKKKRERNKEIDRKNERYREKN